MLTKIKAFSVSHQDLARTTLSIPVAIIQLVTIEILDLHPTTLTGLLGSALLIGFLFIWLSSIIFGFAIKNNYIGTEDGHDWIFSRPVIVWLINGGAGIVLKYVTTPSRMRAVGEGIPWHKLFKPDILRAQLIFEFLAYLVIGLAELILWRGLGIV